MRLRCNHIIMWALILCATSLSAQYQSGLRIENYSGINSASLNPASTASFPLRWDLNLASVGLFVDNNVAYITETSVGDLSKNAERVKVGWEMENIQDRKLVLDFYRDTTINRYIQFNTTINGPSFLFNTNGGQSIGAFFNLRVAGGSPRIPGSLNYYNYINKAANEWIDFPDFSFSFMAWSEIGVHFAQRIPTVNGYMSAGINVKKLNGYEAAYSSLENATELQFVDDKEVVLSGLEAKYGFTTSNVDIYDNGTYNRNSSGSGIGFDIGFNYVVEDESDTYKLKVGASLLDLGKINFKDNAEIHGLSGDQVFTLNEETYQSFTTIEEVKKQASIDIYGSIGLSELNEDFYMWLPSVFSVQADYKFVENVYLSGVFINRIPISRQSIKATNIIILAPRFEHRWGSVSLPITLTEYRRMKAGFSMRLAYFVVGSEDLGALLGTKEFRGADIYFGVKVNPFKFGSSSKKSGKGGKNGNRGKIKCYKF